MEVNVKSKNKMMNTKTTIKDSVVSEIFKDYCSHTSLHGIGYLGANDKTLIEKIWWSLIFIISLTFCAYLISKTWIKWVNSPVIVSFSKEQTSIWEIPFPAVTICPLNKVRQDIYNYSKYFENRNNLTGDEKKLFWDVSLVCNLEYFGFYGEDADKITNEDAIQNIIKMIAPSDYIELVTWQYQYINVDDIFSPQLTDEGICFTSNSFNQQDMFTDKINHDIPYITHNQSNIGWNVENGYPPGLDLNVYPRRTAQDGYVSGLSVTLKTNIKETDYLCGIPVYGYKLILHSPEELPRAGHKYILIPLGRQVTIAVKPELLTTSEGLLSISPKIKRCFFTHEKSLMFFKTYTQNNCKMECIANLTKSYCGCVSFYLPRDKKTLVCGHGQTRCIETMKMLIQQYEMSYKENEAPRKEGQTIEHEIFENCNCLPACSSLHFTSETSQSTSHFVETVVAPYETSLVIDKKTTESVLKGDLMLTQMDIFFKENHIIAVRRSELYGHIDFIANIGGLLGLCLGFSLLSIVEIIYFLTIRVYFKLKQVKNEEKVNTNN